MELGPFTLSLWIDENVQNNMNVQDLRKELGNMSNNALESPNSWT